MILRIRYFFILLLFSASSVFADWGIWDGGIFLDINGDGMAYQNATNFNGSHIGDFITANGDSLVLVGGEAKTWKDDWSDVTGATFHYRIYPIDASPGAFTAVNLPFFSNDGGNNNQTWQNITHSNNVLAALTRPGTYRLEVYFSATGANPNETKFYSNLDNNFIATFNFDIPELSVNGVNANYTTTKFFVNEIEGDSFPLEIVFHPNTGEMLTDVEVFSNLNRRDYATNVWTNAHGVVTHEGIFPLPGHMIEAGNSNHYYVAYPMNQIDDNEYRLTLHAEKAGAYRLSARYRVQGDTNWYYYTDTGMGRRDHAVVVSPITSRDIVMYEVNTLMIKATGMDFEGRSTFVDLWDGPGSDTNMPAWNMNYLNDLGVNWLWFQPIHPYGEDGRHLSAADINNRDATAGANTWSWNGGDPFEDVNYPYALGSPYAVKNFWEVEPRMSKGNTREAAMAEFTNFVNAASDAGVSIMLDAAFNHTSWDVELGDLGVELFAPSASATDEIRDWEARFFSQADNYDQRATSAGDIALAPDRYDFGKWIDVYDVFFGRYAALVPNSGEQGRYQSEEDWFDYTHDAPGFFDQITQNVWKYFGAYVPYWLEKTGYTSDTPPEDIHVGIDGLRCDFGQGLPPQAWEYIINRARSVKWNFIFMAEVIQEGAPAYRANRHFDILNEVIVFDLMKDNPDDLTSTHLRNEVFEKRRNALGEGLVLLNTTSHDEDNFLDPWHPVIRYAAMSTVEGAPMIFPGQELGISELFGYDLYERNFGKWIPHFKTWNTMMPVWNDTDFGNDQLFPVYAGINRARHMSPALRSSNRWFLNTHTGDFVDDNIFAIAKYETPNASPAVSDVVLGFVNLDRNNPHSNTFGIPPALADLLGLTAGREYNVRNIAAHTGLVPGRDEIWLWDEDKDRDEIVNDGIFVSLHGVPNNTAGWTNFPYEAQYLKIYDVTAPPGMASAPEPTTDLHYVLSESVDFEWAEVVDPEGLVAYEVIIDQDGVITTNLTTDTSYEVTGSFGQQVSVTVRPVNPHMTANAGSESPQSATVWLLDPDVSYDGTGVTAGDQDIAGTDPLEADSVFRINQGATSAQLSFEAQPGRVYQILYSDDSLTAGTNMIWNLLGGRTNTTGTVSDESFEADPPASGTRFYRLEVERQ